MASPQKENGYTPIAHEIIEALAKMKIPGQARQVLDVIFRKTYGWNKLNDKISLNQFAKLTGLSKVRVCRCIQTLLSMNLVTKKGKATSYFTKKGNDYDVTYGIQKDYEQWRTLPKKITSVTKKDNVTLPKKITIPIKTNNTKLTTTSSGNFLSDSIEYRLADFLLKHILKRNSKYKNPDIQKWAKSIDLMLRLDKREADDIKAVIQWSQKDLFWQNNILSTKKLRLHFDQLFLKMQDLGPNTGCKRTDANMRAGMAFLEDDKDE